MAQLSRPYQIAFVAMAFLVLVWFVALRGHSSSSSPGSSASAPASAASQAKAAAPSPVYHGAAPGVEGLTRAIAKAHGAVATSQQNAKELQEKSAQASGQSTATTPSTTATHSSQAVAPASTSKSAARTAVKPHKAAASGTPAQQKVVESELKGGKVVLLLFWNPKASVDVAVHKELQAVGRKLRGKIAVHAAEAKQVGSFGSITKAIQVYETPTILLVNRHGVTTTLTGLTDVYSLEQTIEEARHA
ncbi:MAG: hypothetical protein ACHQCH_10965 [Solirubrobacterales bacterium]